VGGMEAAHDHPSTSAQRALRGPACAGLSLLLDPLGVARSC
jgi:hypothetical protein